MFLWNVAYNSCSNIPPSALQMSVGASENVFTLYIHIIYLWGSQSQTKPNGSAKQYGCNTVIHKPLRDLLQGQSPVQSPGHLMHR